MNNQDKMFATAWHHATSLKDVVVRLREYGIETNEKNAYQKAFSLRKRGAKLKTFGTRARIDINEMNNFLDSLVAGAVTTFNEQVR